MTHGDDSPDSISVTEEAKSSSWNHPVTARIAVHVPCYRRAELLPGLFAALESQDLAAEEYEVVVVDDASDDDTWGVLNDLVRGSPMRAIALRMNQNAGPAVARNRAVATSSAPILAFTDDDCLPTVGWLSGLIAMMEPGVVVVQGRVAPPPSDLADAGPWDHTIWVSRPSPFFETCNVAYPRERFDAAGGFDDADPLLRPAEGKHFGEDAVLAWRVLRLGGDRAFAGDALVHHRCVPRTFTEHMRYQRQVLGFPGLARRSPIFGRWLKARVFLSRRSAAFDGAVVSTLIAAATRKPVFLAGALPWGWLAAKDASGRARGDKRKALRILPGVGITDLITFVSLFQGSIRYRRPML